MITSAAYWVVLAASVPAFWLLPVRIRYGFLAAVSWAFLFHIAPRSVVALSLWVILFFLLAPATIANRSRPAFVGSGLILGILGFLAYSKYIPPLLEGARAGGQALVLLGISYYTFKLIHYAIEVGRGNIEDRSFQQFACYMFLMPIFTAGPIERFDHFLENQERHWSRESLVDGGTRIIYGLIKKFVLVEMLLAPMIAGDSTVTLAARLPELRTGEIWSFVILNYIYIYLDFAAYSDIAIGSSRLFGIRIMENFNWPIRATSIVDFWQRWHMTLRGWCQSYIYLPTLGVTRNPYLAIYATFITMGLWHAGSMSRLAWGVYHGTGVVVFVLWSRLKRRLAWEVGERSPLRAVGWLLTFLFVSASFIFSQTEYLPLVDALRLLAKLVFLDLS